MTSDELAVWCDQLLEQGDPLGPILVLARRSVLASGEEEELESLQSRYEATWFTESGMVIDHYFAAKWEHGLIVEIEATTQLGEELMNAVTRCPAARFLRSLELRVSPFAPGPVARPEDEVPSDPITPISQRGLPASLRLLRLWLRRPGRVVDFTPVWPRVPELLELSITCPEVLGELDLPELESLHVIGLQASQLEELAAARLPSLKRLELDECDWSALSKLDHLVLPSLEEIRLAADDDWPSERIDEISAIRFLQQCQNVSFS